METKCTQETTEKTIWHFVCVGCGAEGELELLKADGMKPFGCPEGCGATYVPWKYLGEWTLKCVVMPMFEEKRTKGNWEP